MLKKRWEAATHTRLSTDQQMNKEESKRLTTHHGSSELAQWLHPLHKIQH